MSLSEFLASLSLEQVGWGALVLVGLVVVVLVRRSDSVQYYPGADLASVDIELGKPTRLSFETPDAALIPRRIAREMEPGFLWPGYPSCALWVECYLETTDRTCGVVPTVTMALKIEPAGAEPLQHEGFRLGRSLTPGEGNSPFAGDAIPGVGGRVSHGGDFFRGTMLIAPFRLPPRTRVDVTARVVANQNTTVDRFRLFAARPVEGGGVPD